MVHVMLYEMLWPQRAFCVGTLGPKYLIHGYLEPLGYGMSVSGQKCRNVISTEPKSGSVKKMSQEAQA